MTTESITWVFSQATLTKAMDEWEKEQIKAYPKKKKLIQTSVIALQHFLHSQAVYKHKMVMGGEVDNFDLLLPQSLANREV